MDKAPTPSPELVRRSHLRAEAAVRSISWIYFMAALMTCTVVALSFRAIDLNFSNRVGTAALLVLLAACFVWVGIQFLKLNPVIRLPGMAMSCLGLLIYPFGTALSGYALFLLLSRNGRYVLSQDYRAVVMATPDIRYRMSPLMIAVGAGLSMLLISLLAWEE